MGTSSYRYQYIRYSGAEQGFAAEFRFYVIRHAHKDTGDVPSNTQYNQIGDNRSFGCLITVIRDINRKSEF